MRSLPASLGPCLRLWLIVPGVLAGGCDGGLRGEVVAEGAWVDGEPIRFRQPADLVVAKDGRVDITSIAAATPRFIGVRISYYPAAIPAPGAYQVDPAAEGQIELYCIQPGEGSPPSDVLPPKQYLNSEVSAATITISALPGPGHATVEGSFNGVSLDRMGQNVLTLREGTFWAKMP